MTSPDAYSATRYLASKATIDARSRHPRLQAHLLDALADRSREAVRPLRLFEMGGGVGTLCIDVLEGLLERGVSSVAYTMVDTNGDAVEAARERIAAWGRDRGMDVFAAGPRLVVSGSTADLAVNLHTGDALQHLEDHEGTQFDGIVAQAVLDIVHLPTALQRFRDRSHAETLWYMPIHFDGVTAFEPAVDPELDATIEQLFHDSMTGDADTYGPKGGPHTGRTLLSALPNGGASLVDAAASDWIVFARNDGDYPADEAYFLHHILHFVETELADHPALDADAFRSWMKARRQQVANGELTYVAHQLDVLARASG